MLKAFDYQCPEGHLTEHFAHEHGATRQCFCGQVAKRLLSAPQFKLEGTTGSFPGAAMQWERKRLEKQRIEERKLRDHGEDALN